MTIALGIPPNKNCQIFFGPACRKLVEEYFLNLEEVLSFLILFIPNQTKYEIKNKDKGTACRMTMIIEVVSPVLFT